MKDNVYYEVYEPSTHGVMVHDTFSNLEDAINYIDEMQGEDIYLKVRKISEIKKV